MEQPISQQQKPIFPCSGPSTPTHKNGRNISPQEAGGTGPYPPRSTNLAERLELLEVRLCRPPPGAQLLEGPPDSTSQDVSTILGSPNVSSQHSFSFDAPSLSRSSVTSTGGGSQSNTSLGAAAGVGGQHERRPSSSLQAVSDAAERHIRKVATASGMVLQDGEAVNSNLSRWSTSSASHQTLKTSHTAGDKSANRTGNDAMQLPEPEQSTMGTTDNTNSNSHSKRKKATPIKRELPTVRPPNHTESGKSTGASRKRSRTHFAPLESATPANTNNTAKQLQQEQGLPQKKSSPRKSSMLAGSHTNSRDRSKSPTTRNAKSATKAPKSNKRIHDFFASAVKSRKPILSPKPTSASGPSTVTPALAKPAQTTTQNTVTVPNSNKNDNYNNLHKEQEEVEQLRSKCQELEQLCQDKDAQLKAVSNNRSILHTAVQATLTKREAELADVQKAKEELAAQASTVVEALVRDQADKEAKELREELATEGTRLGRIVYNRTGGLRTQSVKETWEEGHATLQLNARREALLAKQTVLEQRYAAAQKAVHAFEEATKSAANNKENKDRALVSNSTFTGKDHDDGNGGTIKIQSRLEAMEALESVKVHMIKVRRHVKDLEEENRKLNDDKVAHIRALKRVASEDASQFRSRPKLHDRYVLMSLLGKGGFSEVWRAYDLKKFRQVAVKIHQLDSRWSDDKKDNYTKHVSREYEIHRHVRHPRIVSLHDVFEIDSNSFATVLECCDGTDLESLLRKERLLPEREARAILLQILTGMNYLSHPSPGGSRQGIIHYDLKPGNILFDEYGDAKITDFGLSKIVDTPDPAESMELTSQGAGTYWYLPPECFIMDEEAGPVRISNKVDVWSIGVIYYQMLYGKRPFGHGQSQDVLLSNNVMLNAREVNFPDQPQVSEKGKQFIRDCLTYDQAFRPTISRICSNDYVVSKDLD